MAPALVLAVLVAVLVLMPLRGSRGQDERVDERRAELEAAKEAKYAEIRDAELDHRMGKLDEDDWRALDRDLRGQAIELLRRLDQLGEGEPEPPRR